MTKEQKELEVAERKTIDATTGEPTRAGVMYSPQVDIIEDPDTITLRADLPGVKRENVVIDVRDGILSLTATVEDLPNRWQPLYREYEVGGYERRFSVSDRVDTEKISAKMDNGVLSVVLPKTEEQKPRKIKIT